MRRTLLPFVLKLVVVSAVLYTLWVWRGQIWYALFFRQVALAAYGLLGVNLAAQRDALAIIVDRFYNILPFLSLMAAAWGLTWKRRVLGAVLGFAAIVIWHLSFLLIVQSIIGSHGFDPTAYRQLSPFFLFSDALPFVLWVIVAYRPLTEVFETARTRCGSKADGTRAAT